MTTKNINRNDLFRNIPQKQLMKLDKIVFDFNSEKNGIIIKSNNLKIKSKILNFMRKA